MPSSISSFDRHIPRSSGWGGLLGGALLAVLALAVLETFWRGQGHQPSIVDDMELWTYHRRSVSNHDPKTIVLLGASRIQLGFSTAAARKAYPDYSIVQLAVNGTSALPTLKELASDTSFVGLVIYSGSGLFDLANEGGQAEYVHYAEHETTLNRRMNRLMSVWLQQRLTIIDPYLKWQKVVDHWTKERHLPEPRYLTMHFDRSIEADYQALDLAEHRAWRIAERKQAYEDMIQTDYTKAVDAMKVVNEYVREIQARGGEVVFVRFPTTDESWHYDELTAPKARYWDRFSEITSAVTIHFQDFENLRNYDCPDTSHLDRRDAPRFTAALLEILEQRGVLPRPQR